MPNDKQSRAELADWLHTRSRELGGYPNRFEQAVSTIEALEAENARLRETSLHPSGDGDVAFVEWLRAWSKKRFGKWITHSTARGALSELRSALNPEREEK